MSTEIEEVKDPEKQRTTVYLSNKILKRVNGAGYNLSKLCNILLENYMNQHHPENVVQK